MKRSFSEADILKYGGKLSRREYMLGNIYNLNKRQHSCLEAWVNIPKQYRYRVLILLRDLCIRYNNSLGYVSMHTVGSPKNIFIGKNKESIMNILLDFIIEKERPILKIQKWAKKRLNVGK